MHLLELTDEEHQLLKELVAEARQQNEEAFTQIEGDRSIVDVNDFTVVTQDQKRAVDILRGLEVKLNDR